MKIKKTALILATALLLLAAAYSLEGLTAYLRGIMQRTFSLTPLAGIAIGNILFSCLILVIINLIKTQINGNKAAATFYVASGLLASFSMPIYFITPSLPISIHLLSPNSHLAMAGALMVALGLSAFVPTTKLAKSTTGN